MKVTLSHVYDRVFLNSLSPWTLLPGNSVRVATSEIIATRSLRAEGLDRDDWDLHKVHQVALWMLQLCHKGARRLRAKAQQNRYSLLRSPDLTYEVSSVLYSAPWPSSLFTPSSCIRSGTRYGRKERNLKIVSIETSISSTSVLRSTTIIMSKQSPRCISIASSRYNGRRR